jgi:tyrosine-protein phosphatase SIW14
MRAPRRLLLMAPVLCLLVDCSIADGREKLSGVPNYGQVDANLHRGAQPSREGLERLAKEKGIKTVVDLRGPGERSTGEEAFVKSLGMDYISFPMNGSKVPTDAQIEELLAKITAAKGPVFLHCQQGRHRTGTVVACYRIARNGWSNDRALTEAEQYGLDWLTHSYMKRYVRDYKPPAP